MHPPLNASTTPCARLHSKEAGFSIIEGLIAALLLLIVTLGILPLFSRSMNNNIKGNDSTRQANSATDALETSVALPFNSGAMTITAGTSAVVSETMALKLIETPTGGLDRAIFGRWELPADLAAEDAPVMTRQRTLQQFSFDDYADNQTFDTPLANDAEPRLIHLKVVDVRLQDATGAAALPYQLRIVQAF